MKRRHYIGGNASSVIPSSLLFVDTEAFIHHTDADHTELTLRLWCATYVRIENGLVRTKRHYWGRTLEQFWQLVDEHASVKKPLWILAHNARYDMRQLEMWKQFDNGRLEYISRLDRRSGGNGKLAGIMAIDGRPYFVRCRHRIGATVWIVDTMNYWPIGLDELGRSIGLPKKAIELSDATDDELRSYCERDVEIIVKAFTDLVVTWTTEKLGNFRTSAAGLSLQNFRHWHCNTKQTAIAQKQRYDIMAMCDNETHKFERDGYLGGRIEAFYYGTQSRRVYHLDVRSMYPAIMREGFFPIERIKTFNECPINTVRDNLPARDAMCETLIDSDTECFPLRYGGRQVHACGKFWTVLCGQELIRAIDSGSVSAFGRCEIYRTAPLFKDWVDYWHDRRLRCDTAGDASGSMLAKLILNSLHGKFAQRGIRWQDCHLPIPYDQEKGFMRWGTYTWHDYDKGTIEQCRVIAGQQQVQREGEPPDTSFPAISAIICANAREHLRQLIECCPAKSVLYVAVDSLIVTEEGYKALRKAGHLQQGVLGKLRLIGEHNECEIRSQGAYRLDDQWTACGLFGRATMDYRGQWTALDWRYDDTFHFDHDGTVYINRVTVNSPRANPKGELLQSGWTQPRRINKPEEFYRLTISEQRKLLFEES